MIAETALHIEMILGALRSNDYARALWLMDLWEERTKSAVPHPDSAKAGLGRRIRRARTSVELNQPEQAVEELLAARWLHTVHTLLNDERERLV